MKKITSISGLSLPLAMNDIDTDLIIPAQYLTSVSKEGYGKNLFRRLKEQNENFEFNLPQYQNANILITQNNFGCGSSREHAVWALTQSGIEVVIANSFADIFFGNSFKNGLLLITLEEPSIQKLIQNSKEKPYHLNVDLAQEKITTSLGEEISFVLDPFMKTCFLNGFDELDYLMSHIDKIKEFKTKQNQCIPTLRETIYE